jgi:MYXO-CTERM domain-containing protein
MMQSLARQGIWATCVLALLATAGCSKGTASAPTKAVAAVPNSPLAIHSRKITAPSRVHQTSTRFKLGAASHLRAPINPQVMPEAPIPVLSYIGGPILESVQTWAVFWGTTVDPTTVSSIPGFLGEITSNKPYMQQLAQYDINGMTIGSGTFAGSFVDTNAPTATTVTDAMIQQELSRLIDNNLLPANNGHNIFMVYFPPNVTIVQGGGAQSCQVFCAYHGDYISNGANVYYGVMPDLASNGCDAGCGTNPTTIENLYSASSHELTEAITDAAVGTDDLAWYDFTTNLGEIGDICFEFDGSQNSYVVQTEWLNHEQGCGVVGSAENGHLSVTPTAAFPTGGGTAMLTIELGGDVTGDLTLGSTYTNVVGTLGTINFSNPTIKVGDTVTATLTLSAVNPNAAGTYQFKITATDHNGIVHLALIDLALAPPAPTITSFSPTSGPTSGNTTVTINGTKFVPGSLAVFDGIVATTTVNSATKITAKTPSHAAGAVSVQVYNPNQTPATAATQFTYNGTGVTAPTVTAIAPSAGPVGGGQLVTITGTNFSANAIVAIGGIQITDTSQYVIDSVSQARAITPPHAAGAVDVQIINVESVDGGGVAHGQTGTLTGGYTYGGTVSPTVTALSPNSGPSLGGTYLTLTGSDFQNGATVTVGGVAATVKSVHPDFIGLVTPAHAPGAVDVVVTNPDTKTATKTGGFTYTASAAPTISMVNPASGLPAGGTTVTITGTNFAGPSVKIGGNTATVSASTATSITVTTPAHAAGAVDVVVTNPDTQSATATGGFTYIAAAPTITTINPSSGTAAGGTMVTITGTNFATPAVTFGGTAGSVSASTSTSITVTTPAHATGMVDVVVTNADTQSATATNGFTYTPVPPPPPTITTIAPTSGTTAGGTTVTITGTNFSTPAVTFGGTAGTVTAANGTSITLTTPAHAAGMVDVVVTNADTQSATATNGFTFAIPDMAMSVMDMAVPRDLSMATIADLAIAGGDDMTGGGGTGGTGGGGGTGGTGGGGGTGGSGGGGGGSHGGCSMSGAQSSGGGSLFAIGAFALVLFVRRRRSLVA